ncbi:glyoxylase-like metal-dependent hydrolase (beta-lactamase superfamily II) [Paenibacillus castaneae]|uniref:MBL fold metallo-hydrolase n=1 Tax=Paenibacillus castaneae TaxID=474957 RepID=UPI000C9BAFA2|nr:MBL fold metallo-hydrolase [Paenibacillus castaneae]NIK78484.1 glyoxylase-like metal-dependent hydrolase (beta-lactamase superfamily II) [Paenibacillus castaneae]
MNIASGINMLPISAVMRGQMETIYPVLIWDEEEAILVDTGYPGQLPLIQEQVERAGVSLDKLTKIIITHADLDHIGSLPDLLNKLTQNVEVLASSFEKPFIEGQKQLLKITPESIDKAVNALPPEVTDEWKAAFRKTLEKPPAAGVDATIKDGMELPYCGGIVVIATPGHTPGHLSLYHKASKTLIAADSMVVLNDQLLGPNPQYSIDHPLAIQSLQKFIPYDIKTVVCYHGGLFADQANERILQITEQ